MQLPAELSISPLTLDFDSISTQTSIDIRNNGGGVLVWTLSEEISWLTSDLVSGETTTETDKVVITVDRADLSAGDYSGIITITSNGGSQQISITLKVKARDLPKPPGWTN